MKKLIQVIANRLDLQTEELNGTTNLRSLTQDSLEFVELILTLEDKFDIDIEDEDVNTLITISDLDTYLGDHDEIEEEQVER